jgi:hypothetical protein
MYRIVVAWDPQSGISALGAMKCKNAFVCVGICGKTEIGKQNALFRN